jgi:hypothetical protein
MCSILHEIWRYLAVFLYLLTPNQIYDFWNEPCNTDELYDYCFPENGWICWGCAWCYLIIEFILDFIIKFAVNVTQLHDINLHE